MLGRPGKQFSATAQRSVTGGRMKGESVSASVKFSVLKGTSHDLNHPWLQSS
jgi:hypothetical protein